MATEKTFNFIFARVLSYVTTKVKGLETRLNGGSALGFVNDPVRNVEEETFWEFMESRLPEEDEIEILNTMKLLEEEFC